MAARTPSSRALKMRNLLRHKGFLNCISTFPILAQSWSQSTEPDTFRTSKGDELHVPWARVTKPSSPFPAMAPSRIYRRDMSRKGWTFLSNHGHVLVCLADDPDMLLKEVASTIGITERSVQQIVSDLEEAHVITRHREGRRNRYVVRREVRFRHPLEAGLRVGDFIDLARRRPRLRMTDASPRLTPVRERDIQ